MSLALCATWATHGEHSSVELLSILALTLCAILYGAGAVCAKYRGAGQTIGLIKIASTSVGLAVLAITLLSPLHALAYQSLSAHMIQHLLLMLVASPLIVWGRTATVLLEALPMRLRNTSKQAVVSFHLDVVAKIICRPATGWILFSGSIAFWHLPAFYRIAVDSKYIHALMDLTYLGAGLLFWSVVLEPSGSRRLDYGRTIIFVFSTAMVTGLPGALLSFANRPIYPDVNTTSAFGLTPLEDQQLAGLIMWIPMDLVLFGVVGGLFVAWLSGADRGRLATGLAGAAAPVASLLFLLLSACSDSGNGVSRSDPNRHHEKRGAVLIVQYGCGSCHEIPGIRSAHGRVGPPLQRFGRRIYIAGMLRNSSDNLVRWLRDPQTIVPGNAMPNMGMNEADAREISAYLLALQ